MGFKVLISACLLGERVRYDGGHSFCEHTILKYWLSQDLVLSFCPELAGGLPVPRDPAEIVSNLPGFSKVDHKPKVHTKMGKDITQNFLTGAKATLKIALEKNVRMAVLKDKSPSCGSTKIYDGSFQKNLILGMGLTAALLKANKIPVFSEKQWNEASSYFHSLIQEKS